MSEHTHSQTNRQRRAQLSAARQIAPADLEAALGDAGRLKLVREGFRIAILGPPNAGKSSLMNRLARREAAIVSPIAGTTRDVVEVRLVLAGYPVWVADTAGLREASDAIEAEGVRRALARAAAFRPDLVLVSAGFDAHRDDPLGGLLWTLGHLALMPDAWLPVPVVAVLGREGNRTWSRDALLRSATGPLLKQARPS